MNRREKPKQHDIEPGARTPVPHENAAMAGAAANLGEDFFRMIVENGDDFFAVLDLEGRRLYNSPSYARLFGDPRGLKGSDSFAEIHPDDQARIKTAFMDTVKSGHSHRLNFRFVLPNGDIRYMESCGTLIRNHQGQALRVAVVSRDITERVKKETEIYNLAFHDALTKLPNRRLLNDRFDQAMAASKRSGRHGALMLLDLDNFKLLNDAHGHAMGDALLMEVGHRITGCLRETDTVARLGGDEFVLLLSELSTDKAESRLLASNVAEKVLAALSRPYVLKHHQQDDIETIVQYLCTASIGVTLFVDHKTDMEDVLKQADAAMYRAKDAGRNSIRFHAAQA